MGPSNECRYYKRVSTSHVAIGLVATLSCAVMASMPVAEPAQAVWPVDVAWTRDFPLDEQFSLVIGDSRLLVVEPTTVIALAWTDGTELWTSELGATAVPVADEGHVFIPTGGQVHALSEVSGHVEWSLPTGRVSASPAARGGWLIIADDDGMLHGVDVSRGRVLWQRKIPRFLTAALVIDGDLVVGGFADGSVIGWSITDGSVRWTTRIGTRPNQLLASSRRVFVAGDEGRLISLHQRNGTIEWDYPFRMAIVGRLAADGQNVYASTIDNAVRAHAFNGNQRWRMPVASRIVDGLFVDAGSVFVPQSSGEVRMFLAAGGNRSGRLVAPSAAANVTGALASAGTGQDLRMAITTSAGSSQTVIAYRRTGLGLTIATAAPQGETLALSAPPWRR